MSTSRGAHLVVCYVILYTQKTQHSALPEAKKHPGMSVAKQQLGELLEIWKTTRGSNEPIQGSLDSNWWYQKVGFLKGPKINQYVRTVSHLFFNYCKL